MPGLSAKVFRTYNASITLCSELQKTSQMVREHHLAKYIMIARRNVILKISQE